MRYVCGQCRRQFDAASPEGDTVVTCPHCGHVIGGQTEAGDSFTAAVAPVTPLGPLSGDLDGFAGLAKRAASRELHLECANCHKHLVIPTRMSRKKVRCPGCGNTFRVPQPTDGSAEARDHAPDEFHAADHEAAAEPEGTDLAEGLEPPPEGFATPEPLAPGEHTGGSPHRARRSAQAHSHAAPPAAAPPAVDLAEGVPVGSLEDELAAAADQSRAAVRLVVEPAGGSGWWVYAVVAAMLAVGALVIILILVNQPEPAPPTGATGNTASSDNTALVGPPPTVPIVPPNVPVVPPDGNGSRPPPPAAGAAMDLASAWIDVFASPGRHAARPSRAYWHVRLRVKAGRAPLSFRAPGGGIVLAADTGVELPALGGPQAGPLGEPAAPLALTVPAGKTQEVELLFDVPRELRSATLRIPGAEPLRLKPLPAGIEPGEAGLAGTYREEPPRNLRPLLHSPVMAAIQAGVGGELVVAPAGGGGMELRIAAAGVRGAVRAVGDGTFTAVLERAGAVLHCRLRLFDQGHALLLYLSESPYHQITYRRAS